jgi:hypothetical protein
MKKLILSLAAVAALGTANAQLMLSEDFTASTFSNNVGFTWFIQNNTNSPGLDWFQGNGPATFPAYNGGSSDYVAANWASTADTAVATTLSNWLIAPVVSLMNGAVLQFATRTSTNPSPFPDRLEVYMSTAGTGINVGNTPTSLGTFSTLVTSINPNLTSTGYPGSWQVFSTVLSGITGTQTGRFAFRYHVTNGGWAGANSDYIGLDAVRYYMPCGLVANSYTTCAGQSATLSALGQWTNTTYTWSPINNNNSSVVVNPASTTVYTLGYTEANNQCPQQQVTVTISNTLNVNIAASDASVCPGDAITYTASGPASSYTWVNTNTQNAVVTVTPGSTTIYTVAGQSGFCFGGNTITAFVHAPPVISANIPTTACMNKSFTLTGTGGVNYVWDNGMSIFTGSTVVGTASIGGPVSYTVFGIDANGCVDDDTFTINEAANPTITASAVKTVMCTNETFTINASGAVSYTFTSVAATFTTNPPLHYVPTTAGAKAFTVTGANADGCTHIRFLTVTANACTGLPNEDQFNGFSLFPNPFSSEITVSGYVGTVTIYNISGAAVKHEQVNGALQLNTADLPKGSYLIQAKAATGEVIRTMNVIRQ